MGGKRGVEKTKILLTVPKLATIAILQAISKDGFQPGDLVSFMKSDQFHKSLEPAIDHFQEAIEELCELDIKDDLVLGKFLYDIADDILDEVKALRAKAKK